MMKPRGRLTLVATILSVLVLGCTEEEGLRMYQLVSIQARDIVLSATADGLIEPIQTIEVKSKASGEITEVRPEVGDAVRRGSLLVLVDRREAQNALIQAEADIEVADAQVINAESAFHRADALFETQSTTEQDFENARLGQATARAQLVGAQRALQDAQISFEDTEVRAPINGVVLERNVEVGTVISSATRSGSGGSVLLRMADLDTVQVRAPVPEIDIGKIEPGMAVTVIVDAYPNEPFRGTVLKIEPESLEQQNVTMFPVLVRIANPNLLLRPGMNADVEIHIGSQPNVISVPNAALRSQRDLTSVAEILGVTAESIRAQLAGIGGGTGTDKGPTPTNQVEFFGRQVTLPEGLTKEKVEPVLAKLQGGAQGLQSLSADERAIMSQLRDAMGGGGGAGFGGGEPGRADAGGPRGRQRGQSSNFQFGGDYIAFVMRGGVPTAVNVRTGLTDLDYSQVVDGLVSGDTVLVLPSSSLYQQQREMAERIGRMSGGIPGVGAAPGGRR